MEHPGAEAAVAEEEAEDTVSGERDVEDKENEDEDEEGDG